MIVRWILILTPGPVRFITLQCESKRADAVAIAMDCSTMSRMREKPIKGVAGGPQPL